MKSLFYPFFTLCFSLLLSPLAGQNWQSLGSQVDGVAGMSESELSNYHTFQLDWEGLVAHISQAPAEGSPQTFAVQIPLPSGKFQAFDLETYELLPAPLAAKFPQIHALKGQGISDARSLIRLDLTDWGLHVMVMGTEGTYFIEPLNRQSKNTYIAYWLQDVIDAEARIEDWCGTDDSDFWEREETLVAPETIGEDMLVYRFGALADASYTAALGGVSGAMSAIVTLVNQMNGLSERDLAIRLQLLPNNDLLIFDGTTPFTNTGVGQDMLPEVTGLVNNIIGVNNYDIAHALSVFESGGAAGIAYRASVCTNFKGGGVTTNANSGNFINLAFLGTFSHEVGHQLGSPHTFNGNIGGCDGNGSGSSAYEPGSGTTIVAYPGLCASHNTQGFRDFYYHVGSIQSIINHTRFGSGTCASILSNTNAEPVVDAGSGGFFIPLGTPFELTGSATDADGDSLTYCWEQYDLGPSGHPDFPVGNAPIFRSYLPVAGPSRTFPKITDILNGTQIRGEILPSYARDLTFRLTVRDLNGGVTIDQMEFEATDAAGPFLVTSPNTNVDWTVNTYQTVTWDVANTDQFPVNCQMVNLRLSTDGGFTYPHTLASNVPNDGLEVVLVPNLPNTTTRLRVEAADNVFFDLSDRNFSISQATSGNVSVFFPNVESSICADGNSELGFLSTSVLGYSDPVSLNAGGIPPGITVSFSQNPFSPGDSVAVLFSGDGSTPAGIYSVSVIASGLGVAPIPSVIQLRVITEPPSLLQANFPVDGANGVAQGTSFSWDPDPAAEFYTFELATSPGFGATTFITATDLSQAAYLLSAALAPNTAYYWRVRAENICGPGPITPVRSFHTGRCNQEVSANVPISIPIFGNPTIVDSDITVSLSGTVSDINVTNLRGLHESVSELQVSLISPNGIEVKLFSGICEDFHQDFDLNFDSESGQSVLDCPPSSGGTYQPLENLNAFVGEVASGPWTLRIRDTANFNGGELQNWGLEICTDLGVVYPLLLTNDTLQATRWQADPINQALLEATDGSSSASDLRFTLVAEPLRGQLVLDGTALVAGDAFSQDDLNLDKLIYQHNGSSSPVDSFRFDVSNQIGGWIGVFAFQVAVDMNTATDPLLAQLSLHLQPNPAHDQVEVALSGMIPNNLQLKLLTLHGQTIWQQSLHPQGGELRQSVPLTDLASGLYLIQVQSERGSLYRKLLVE